MSRALVYAWHKAWSTQCRSSEDGKGQPYVEWDQAHGNYKRAWIQRKGDKDKDWAGASRYLNVVRCNSPGHPGGNPTDFPIYNELPDEQILRAFVYSASAITGCPVDEGSDAKQT